MDWSSLRDLGSLQLPPGRCLYIQAGDPSDFDGYLIAAAAATIRPQDDPARDTAPAAAQQHSDRDVDFEPVIVIPERRAWPDAREADVSKHDDEYSASIRATVAQLVRAMGRNLTIVQGPLNSGNIIPWAYHAKEFEVYGTLVRGFEAACRAHSIDPDAAVDVKQLAWLKARVLEERTTSVILDASGSIGYLADWADDSGFMRVLGAKIRASGRPVAVMGGVLAEVAPQTLPLPGRDPRATMNAIYSPAGVTALLRLAADHGVSVLFTPNNVANECLRYEDADALAEGMGLSSSALADAARAWFRPHLRGKYVPFDWVNLVALLAWRTAAAAEVRVQTRVLYVPDSTAAPASAAAALVLAVPEHAEAWEKRLRGDDSAFSALDEAVQLALKASLGAEGVDACAPAVKCHAVHALQSVSEGGQKAIDSEWLQRLCYGMVAEHQRRQLAYLS